MNDNTLNPPPAYRPAPPAAFDFGEALKRIKAGKKCFRTGWGDSSYDFVFLVAGSTFFVNRPPLLGIYPEGTKISYHGHIDIRTHDGSVMVWTPTQDDVLLEDWHEVA